MYTDTLIQLGLAQNEARIYETLLREGESSVGEIAIKSGVHRRNVYDSLNRLLEKGLVFEVLERKENHYQAVEPSKLTEMLREKQESLDKILPNLHNLYSGTPHINDVYIYKGVEGWKNYMREILRLGQDCYTIAGKGAWATPRLGNFFAQFVKEANRKGIAFHTIYDAQVKTKYPELVTSLGNNYRFLPDNYLAPASIDIFADRVVILSHVTYGDFKEDESFTVIVNQQIADAFRIWFQFMWDACPPVDGKKARVTEGKTPPSPEKPFVSGPLI